MFIGVTLTQVIMSFCMFTGSYYAPMVDTLAEYREFIDNLPQIDEPEIFGMHDNANIAFQVSRVPLSQE